MKWTKIIAAAACVLLTAGCQAEVISEITVTGPGEAQVTAAVALHGELVDAASEQELATAVATRVGVAPDAVNVSTRDDKMTASVTVPLSALTTASAVTGVRSVTASGDDSAQTLEVGVGVPDALLSAIVTAATQTGKDEVDIEALATAAAGSTDIVIRVSFPGDVTSAQFNPAVDSTFKLTTNGRTAELRQPLSSAVAGDLVVTGKMQRPRELPVNIIGVAVLAAVLVAGAAIRDRRRSDQNPPRP